MPQLNSEQPVLKLLEKGEWVVLRVPAFVLIFAGALNFCAKLMVSNPRLSIASKQAS
jgi:hypothetical protein